MPENTQATICDDLPTPSFDEPPEAYYGLLTDPPGQYGTAKYGASTAFTLRGSEAFLTKAQNLFDSFGGGSEVISAKGYGPRRVEHRPTVYRQGNDEGSLFFCMAPKRFKRAIYLYLYGRLIWTKGDWKRDYDEEGNYQGSECLNEKELEKEAEQLTQSFMTHKLALDYRAIPEYAPGVGLTEHEFHDSQSILS